MHGNLILQILLQQEDRPWDWDRLFTEISSELTTEWEKAAGETNTEQAET